MERRRVVITGVGLASPIGNSLDEVSQALREGRSGVRRLDWLAAYDGMRTRVGGPVAVDLSGLPRKRTRTMGRVAKLSTWATARAIADAGLDAETVSSGRVGLAHGSTAGSSDANAEFVRKLLLDKTTAGIRASTYLRFMSHTTAANLALYFHVRGRVLTTCSACVSASQAIGYGYEQIRSGAQDAMLCGGAEELEPMAVSVFDLMFATSTAFNDAPEETPRPFDARRDGLVISEGAGTLVLEALEHAEARGATVYAEVLGYGTSCDGLHMTAPSQDGMERAMRLALADAGVAPEALDYVNAHATATEIGDVCESRATHAVVGGGVPISSCKGFTGHTLGACGAVEAAFCLAMMRDGFLAPNHNLAEVDPELAPLDYIVGGPRAARPRTVMTNNFAFAGLNTSLILRAL